MKLSVVIPTLGRDEVLFDTIDYLENQTLDRNNWELLVIIQSKDSVDRFNEKQNKWNINIKVIFSPAPNASLARNIGLIEAKGEYVLFLDDDLIIENTNFLKAHIDGFNDKKVSGVFGQVLDPGVPERKDRHNWSYKKHIGWMFFPPNYNKKTYLDNGGAGNLSVNKEKALSIKGMDILFNKGAHREESEFCLRYTRKFGPILFEPAASVIHLGAAKGGSRNWGKNEGIHPKHHVFGEWYFILKGLKLGTVKFYQLHYHLGVLFFRQIWNAPNKKNPLAMLKAIGRSFVGFFKALYEAIKIKEKKRSLLPDDFQYELLFLN